MKYLKNPFVVLGLIGIGYYFVQKRKILKKTPKAKQSVKEIDEKGLSQDEIEKRAKENKVPMSLITDCEKMNKKDIARTILANQKMLNEEKMSNDERNHILKMVDYLEKELEKR
jgi:hypothetical protein|tara:strand:- start:94 stop:435 length:342 start_codon:yes stop_codon:yes gene_type:complete